MNIIKDVEDPRRRVLVEALALGLIAAGLPARDALARSWFGNKPKQKLVWQQAETASSRKIDLSPLRKSIGQRNKGNSGNTDSPW